MTEQRALLRRIPKVDEMLKNERLSAWAEQHSRRRAVELLRELTEELRHTVLSGKPGDEVQVPDAEQLALRAAEILENEAEYHLRRVINATGVVLHTNLGRAVLPEAALRAVQEAAGFPSNLEYDLERGGRGSRHGHVEEILKKLTGAEAAMVVNNNAAAVLLCLSALAAGKEVLVSRGEEVEIGGSFRVPDIMRQSGAVLVEVGTTNRTKPEDYRSMITENTAALLKVHTSNYRVVGFTRETTLEELCALGHEKRIPVLYDMGSGLFADLSRRGIDEPLVPDALKAGADLVLFSGDKLLGGPQAGFAVGKKELIEKMKKHPLARAVRVDKMTIAAAEAVLSLYLDPDRALREVPTLRHIAADQEELCARALELKKKLETKLETKLEAKLETVLDPAGWILSAEPCGDRVGGGAAPETELPGYAVTVRPAEEQKKDETGRGPDRKKEKKGITGTTVEALERQLRCAAVPVICRISEGRLWFSLRTVELDEEELLAQGVAEAMARVQGSTEAAARLQGNTEAAHDA